MGTITHTDIADYFIALSNDTQNLITNLKLQKLLYYTQAWFLAVNREPLFNDDFQAWVHGPVIPTLYHQYKHLGYTPITEDKDSSDDLFNRFDESVQAILGDVVEEYFGKTAFELEQLTHSEDPWIIARANIPDDQLSTAIIDKNTIRDYYSQFVLQT